MKLTKKSTIKELLDFIAWNEIALLDACEKSNGTYGCKEAKALKNMQNAILSFLK